jgi:restriction system protein
MINTEDAMIPVLKVLDSRGVLPRKFLIDAVADQMQISEQDREVMLPSGVRPKYRNHIGWAMSLLKKAGLVTQPCRGSYEIADEGRKVLASGIAAIDGPWLRAHSEVFDAWVRDVRSNRRRSDDGQEAAPESGSHSNLTPEDAMDQAHATMRAELVDEILDQVKERDPGFFEHLVVRLLVKMGYGGSFADAARSVGKSGDGGIDGIIKEDRLGLDAIYIQAKRIQGSVGRPAVQAFVGAITGHRASKGVFLTTGTFTREAEDYVRNLDKTVVLVDGERLAELMIEFNLGVTLEQTYEIKRIDSDFFEE